MTMRGFTKKGGPSCRGSVSKDWKTHFSRKDGEWEVTTCPSSPETCPEHGKPFCANVLRGRSCWEKDMAHLCHHAPACTCPQTNGNHDGYCKAYEPAPTAEGAEPTKEQWDLAESICPRKCFWERKCERTTKHVICPHCTEIRNIAQALASARSEARAAALGEAITMMRDGEMVSDKDGDYFKVKKRDINQLEKSLPR